MAKDTVPKNVGNDEAIWINEQETSGITGIAVQTLRNDRHQGKGFTYYKRGRMVRYKRPEIIEDMEQYRVVPPNTVRR